MATDNVQMAKLAEAAMKPTMQTPACQPKHANGSNIDPKRSVTAS